MLKFYGPQLGKFIIYIGRDLGCHIITIPPDLLKKIDLEDKDLEELSLETVNMFYNDACESGYKI